MLKTKVGPSTTPAILFLLIRAIRQLEIAMAKTYKHKPGRGELRRVKERLVLEGRTQNGQNTEKHDEAHD